MIIGIARVASQHRHMQCRRKQGFLTLPIVALLFAFTSHDSGKYLANSRWTPDIALDRITDGDTLVFRKNNKHGEILFKTNGKVQRHQWIAHCGNLTMKERQMLKKRAWKDAGSWKFGEEKNITLDLDAPNGKLILKSIVLYKDSIRFFARTTLEK
jgi:hypothetical protein